MTRVEWRVKWKWMPWPAQSSPGPHEPFASRPQPSRTHAGPSAVRAQRSHSAHSSTEITETCPRTASAPLPHVDHGFRRLARALQQPRGLDGQTPPERRDRPEMVAAVTYTDDRPLPNGSGVDSAQPATSGTQSDRRSPCTTWPHSRELHAHAGMRSISRSAGASPRTAAYVHACLAGQDAHGDLRDPFVLPRTTLALGGRPQLSPLEG